MAGRSHRVGPGRALLAARPPLRPIGARPQREPARALAIGRWQRCQAVVIPPDVEHEVDARGVPVLIGFIDAESELTAGLAGAHASAIAPTPDGVAGRWRRSLGDPRALAADGVEAWLRSQLSPQGRPRPLRPRVRRVLRHVRDQTLSARQSSLERLAVVTGLSPSRLMHVFSESMGTPLRPYLLWLRVQRAAGALAAGQTIADAAYSAGFADGAHLTRTFRRMFGMTPREMIRRAPTARELRLGSA